MAKKLVINDRIKDLIIKNSGDPDFDFSAVTVYECISVNTLPLSKAGTLYHKGVLEPSLLQEMAEYVNNAGAVPLHQIHDQGEALPVGRVFYSETKLNFTGVTELRSLFYLPNKETDLIQKLELNVIDEVSVGVRPLHLYCSKCKFDFLGAEATFENLWSQTCNNDHTIGVDGMFTRGEGLDKWMELSLVSKGAANNAKILGRTKQLLGEEAYNRIAASGSRPEATVLFATATKDHTMDLTELVKSLTAAQTADGLKAAQIATLTAENTGLKTQLTAAQTEVTELKAKAVTPPDVATLQASLTAAQTEAKTAVDFVREEADRLAVASASDKPAAAATLAELTASITASRAKLAANPTGGVANPANGGTGTSADATVVVASSAFKKPTNTR